MIISWMQIISVLFLYSTTQTVRVRFESTTSSLVFLSCISHSLHQTFFHSVCILKTNTHNSYSYWGGSLVRPVDRC